MYSECVLEGITGAPDILIDKTMEFASEVGALKHQDFYDPFGVDGQGCINSSTNSSTANTPCVFICHDNNGPFPFCENNTGPVGMIYDPFAEANTSTCSLTSVDDGTIYNFNSFAPAEYYLFSDLEKVDLDPEDLESQVNDILCDEETGVVLIIDDYKPDGSSDSTTQHAIYVHGNDGNGKHIYKDSWPGNPDADRIQTIDWTKVVKAFKITGSVTISTEVNDPPCDCTIVDPGTISGPTVVSTTGDCSDLDFTESISSDNLDVSITSTGQLLVTPNQSDCGDTGFISIDGCSSFYANFDVDPEPLPVLDIFVLAQELCPGDVIELDIYDNNNAFPATTYNWNIIAGGSIASGQGSPVIFVSIPPSNESSNNNNELIVTVTAVNACGVSEVFRIKIPISDDCGNQGGGQHFIGNQNNNHNELCFGPNPVDQTIFIYNPKGTEIQSQIFNIEGQLIIQSSNNSINVKSLPAGVYYIQMIDKITGVDEISKFIKQ